MEEREGLGLAGNVSALGWLELELMRPGLQRQPGKRVGLGSGEPWLVINRGQKDSREAGCANRKRFPSPGLGRAGRAPLANGVSQARGEGLLLSN